MKLFLSEFTVPTDHANWEFNFWVTRRSAGPVAGRRAAHRPALAPRSTPSAGCRSTTTRREANHDEVNRGLIDASEGKRKPAYDTFSATAKARNALLGWYRSPHSGYGASPGVAGRKHIPVCMTWATRRRILLLLVASLVATPFAIRLAVRTGFYDQPWVTRASRRRHTSAARRRRRLLDSGGSP